MSDKTPQVLEITRENGESQVLVLRPPKRAASAPAADLAVDVARAAAYAREAHAKNTQRAYAADWRGFREWCEQRGGPPESANPAVVAAYLAAMADDGYTAATIDRAATGIAWHMRQIAPAEWPRKEQPKAVRDTLAGIHNTLGVAPKYRKASCTLDMVGAMMPQLGDGLEGLRNRAIVLVGFWAAMRRSEIAALDVTDVTVDAQGMRLVLRRSKTDQEGRGMIRGVAHSDDAVVCGPCAVARWLKAAPALTGPLFRGVQGERVLPARIQPAKVAQLVQRACEALGLRASRFGAHSLRAGFVTTAAKQGKSLQAIMRQTGHRRTDQLLEYVRPETVFDDNATRGLK